MKPTISILSLGGTITSSSVDAMGATYSGSSCTIDDICSQLPNIDAMANITTDTLFNVISHEISSSMLFTLAARINELVADPNITGIVVTQGTNALEEVAYFINLVINTEKPIIFTGAMKTTNALGFDGARNLYNAIVLACAADAKGKGVLITFNDTIVGARDAIKSATHLHADFCATPWALLGHIHDNNPHFYRYPSKRHTHNSEFTNAIINSLPTIYIFYGHLAADHTLIEAMTNLHVRGIISVGMGAGYQPLAATLALAKASSAGIPVIRCTSMPQGIAHWDENTDGKYGFIPGDSLTPQKARILLGLALSKTADNNEIKRIFSEY